MLQMNESTISRSINKLIQRRIILKDETRNAYHLSMDRLTLNNRVACKCSAGNYFNERTPLLLSEDCSYSELPFLLHSSKYIVRKLTVDGKEFDAMGRMRSFDAIVKEDSIVWIYLKILAHLYQYRHMP